MRVIIAGCRTFTDYRDLHELVRGSGIRKKIKLIITGGAKGADELGKEYAKINEIDHFEYLPEWEKYGRSAGPIRNKKMIEAADGLLAIWDGSSKGTAHIISEARKKGIFVKILLV
jgi:uncharacterized phage-like protein YoqJ